MGDREDIEAIFREYVFGFIFHDIEREIWLAKKAEHDALHSVYPGPHPGGGNLLAALGLLAYTEFLGTFVTGKSRGESANFNAVLALMPPCYAAFDAKLATDPTQKGIYHTFRNGMAHEYAVKRDCDIFMLNGRETCGIGEDDDRYYFVVERYFQDFCAAANRVYQQLLKNPILPK